MNNEELRDKCDKIQELARMLMKCSFDFQKRFFNCFDKSIPVIERNERKGPPSAGYEFYYIKDIASLVLDRHPTILYEWEVVEEISGKCALVIKRWSYRKDDNVARHTGDSQGA